MACPRNAGRDDIPCRANRIRRGTSPVIAGWRCAQYDGIVALAAVSIFGRGRGVSSMMVVLLIAGIGFLLAGLLGIGFGIPVKEFSFGNTLILTGVVAACTGMIMLGLWVVVRELKNIAQQLGLGVAQRRARKLPAAAQAPPRTRPVPENDGFPFGRDQPRLQVRRCRTGSATIRAVAGAWQEEAAARDRARSDAAADQPKPRRPSSRGAICCFPRPRGRNASAPRRERPIRPRPIFVSAPPAAPPPSNRPTPPPATFDDAWPQSERSQAADAPPPRRSGRAPSTLPSRTPARPAQIAIRRPRETRISRR